MRISIYSMLRLICLMTIVATITGVLTNRLIPDVKPVWTVDHKQPWAVGQHLINPFTGHGLILNTNTDQTIQLQTSRRENLDLLSVSPFQDEKGVRQMICRVQYSSGEGTEMEPGSIQVARYSYPTHRLLDQREIDWLPNSQPTWDLRTDNGLKCVFSTGAGQLVRLDWTGENGRRTSHRGQEIQWAVEPPFGAMTFIVEPSWMPGVENTNRMLVTIWGNDPKTREPHLGIAWIELDERRDAIIDYGMISDSILTADNARLAMRYPTFHHDSNGALHLFWYERQAYERAWHLKTAPIVSSTGRTQKFQMGRSRTLASGCQAVPFGFSDKLRYVYFVVPNTLDCYDGGTWRKIRFQADAPLLVASNAPGLDLQTAGAKAAK